MKYEDYRLVFNHWLGISFLSLSWGRDIDELKKAMYELGITDAGAYQWLWDYYEGEDVAQYNLKLIDRDKLFPYQFPENKYVVYQTSLESYYTQRDIPL